MSDTEVGAANTSVQSLINRAAVWVSPDLSLREVAAVLTGESIGAVLVRGRHGQVGIVSERDIVAALADDANPSKTVVEDICSWELATIAPLASVEDAANAMLDAEVRHLPVVADGHPTEIISERDIVQAYTRMS